MDGRHLSPKSCQEIYLADNNALDGTYTIDPDGYNGPSPLMTAQCDFETMEWTTKRWMDYDLKLSS